MAHESSARGATSTNNRPVAEDAPPEAHSYASTRIPSTNRSYRLTTGETGQKCSCGVNSEGHNGEKKYSRESLATHRNYLLEGSSVQIFRQSEPTAQEGWALSRIAQTA